MLQACTLCSIFKDVEVVDVKVVCSAQSCCLIEIGIINKQARVPQHDTGEVVASDQLKAHPEVVEGDRGVVRKQGAQLVQAGQHHKGAAVMLGRQSHDMGPHRGHDATIG